MALYLGASPSAEERTVIYSYMALGGFLWTLWAVYKSNLGETFGDYTLVMYRYAKDYYKFVKAI
jgi:thiamine kinase-like enzyme